MKNIRFFNSPNDRIKFKALKRAIVDAKTALFAPTHSHYVGVELFLECADAAPNNKIKQKFTKLAKRVIDPDFRLLCHRDPNHPQWSAPDQIEKEFGHDVAFMLTINEVLKRDYWRDLRKIHYVNFHEIYPEIGEEQWP